MQSLDARLAAHVKASGVPPTDVDEAIAQVVHDQGVDAAVRAFVAASLAGGRHVAGVMGSSRISCLRRAGVIPFTDQAGARP